MWRRVLRLAVVSAVLLAGGALVPAGGDADGTDVPGRIVGAALVESEAWDKLAYLCDRIGHRLSGSAGMERAVEWAAAGQVASGRWRWRREEGALALEGPAGPLWQFRGGPLPAEARRR